MKAPRWKAAGALVLLGAIVYFIVTDWPRFLQDFWPVDASRIAPNIVASIVQWAVVLIIAALLYPPTRRMIKRAADETLHRHLEHHRALTAVEDERRHTELLAQADKHHKAHLAAVRKAAAK